MTADGPKPQTTDEIFKAQEGRAVRGAGRLHADLRPQSSAGLREERRRHQGEGRRHHRGHRRERRVRDERVEEVGRGRQGRVSRRRRRGLAKAIGLTIDLTERGLGVRSQRYSMVVEDGVVKSVQSRRGPGKAEASGAENLLKSLRALPASRSGNVTSRQPRAGCFVDRSRCAFEAWNTRLTSAHA